MVEQAIQTKCEPIHAMAPTTFGEAMEFSKLISSSALVPQAYRGKPADILVAIQLGHSVGLPPIQSLQWIAVINGRPCLYGDAALAIVRRSRWCQDVVEQWDDETQTATCSAYRRGSKPVHATFSLEDAKRAGLLQKKGPWSDYPRRMAQMRARGFALRDAFPDVLLGLSVAEEAMDIPAEAPELEAAPKPKGTWRKGRKAPTIVEAEVDDEEAQMAEMVADIEGDRGE
jgi:hypothetical protein